MTSELQQPRTLETIAFEIQTIHANVMRTALDGAVEIGRRLIEAKSMVEHGSWESWLEANVPYSKSKSERLMRLYDEYGDPQGSIFGATVKASAMTDLSPTQALELLALPASEREEFVEENDAKNMSVRELKKAIKERDKAQKLSDEEIAKLRDELQAKNAIIEEAVEARAKADAHIKSVEESLTTLQAMPNTVVEGYSEDDLKKARDEAEKEAEQQIKELKGLRDAAHKDAQKAQKERDALESKVQALEKKQANESDTVFVVFQEHFGLVQTHLNKLTECIQQTKDAEKQKKFAAALTTLFEKSSFAVESITKQEQG